MSLGRGAPGIRRPMVLAGVLVALTVAALVAPVAAFAVTDPQPTIWTTPFYMKGQGVVSVRGWLGAGHAGKKVAIEIQKPGREYWDQVVILTANSGGYYWGKYKPKLGGKFFIRARCLQDTTDQTSRIAELTVSGTIPKTDVLLASTTSTKDSGLFERIGPVFKAQCPEYNLKATFVGSGAAIQLGGAGNADVLLTHSPADEVAFMGGMYKGNPTAYRGLNRFKVMYNDFVLVGPTANPAAIGASVPATEAFQAIATAGSTFWSRNDASGTNSAEKSIWALIGNPQLAGGVTWYKASGTMTMAQALAAANDASTGGYTLSDRATWLNSVSLQTVKNLKIVNQGDPKYFNQYSVIEVKGARNAEGAQDFSNWIRSAYVQDLIGTYGEFTYPGQVMFVPNAGSY